MAAEVAAIFALPSRSVAASTRLEESARNPSEAALWSLSTQLLLDAERSPTYYPEAIPIAPAPTRAWHVSHTALLQWAVQSSRTLRVINTLLLWLEACHDGSERSHRLSRLRVGTVRSPTDAALLRETVVEALRSGDCETALSLAEHAHDGPLSVVLRLARPMAVDEPWQRPLPLVRLFGEYGQSLPMRRWVDNSHRGGLLSNLYDEAEARASDGGVHESRGGDALVAAVLSGHRRALGDVFHRSWQDSLWATLRAGAVLIFARASRQALSSRALEAAVDDLCGGGEDEAWVERAARRVADDASCALRRVIEAAPPTEQLHIHLALLALAPDMSEALPRVPPSGDDPVPTASLLLLLSAAFREGLCGVDPQTTPLFGEVLSRYMSTLAHQPSSDYVATMRQAVSIIDTCQSASTRVDFVRQLVRHVRLRMSGTAAVSSDAMDLEVALLQDVSANEAARADDARTELLRGVTRDMPYLLTHCPLSEVLLWRAALRRPSEPSLMPAAFDTLADVWLEDHDPHCSADAVHVTLSFIARSATLSDDDVARLALWESVAVVRVKSVQHAATTARYRETRDDEVASAEVQLRNVLLSHTERIVRVFLTDRRAGVSVAVHAIVTYCDACTLALRGGHRRLQPHEVLLTAMGIVRLARDERLIGRVTRRQAEELMAAAVRVRAAYASFPRAPRERS